MVVRLMNLPLSIHPTSPNPVEHGCTGSQTNVPSLKEEKQTYLGWPSSYAAGLLLPLILGSSVDVLWPEAMARFHGGFSGCLNYLPFQPPLLPSLNLILIHDMIPHKTKCGAAALALVKAYEGILPSYDSRRVIVQLVSFLANCVQILDTNPQLFFHLQQQRLIELIRNGKVEEALEFAQEELAPRGEENQSFLEELERTVALLAFEDVSNCPVGELLDISQRLKTASEVNAAILTSQSHEKDPKLPSLLKMLLWAQNQLDEKASYPRINNLSTAALEDPTV
ncbi:Glucose-induced degradation protein [Nymphaea thermarum]|nr:Glucose-induced degradation protein [Nymphaea thermarum]